MDIRACIYSRVSTQEQAGGGKTSIGEQVGACKKTILGKGWQLVGEYKDEGISGAKFEERLGLQDLLADANQNKFDVVVVKDFDRLARSRTQAGRIRDKLKKQLVQTYSLSTPVEPRDPKVYDPMDDDLVIMNETFSDAFSEIERNKIRKRMTLAKTAIAKQGKIPNNAPYGYSIKRTLDDHGIIHRQVVVNDEEAPIVKRIFQQTQAGVGRRNVALQLNKEGIKPPRSESWTSQAVKYILKNPTYAGYVRWGWRHADYKTTKTRKQRGHEGLIVEGRHEAIISKQQFDEVQQRMIDNAKKSTHHGRAQMSKGLLTGIAKCIRCGGGVTYCRRKIPNSKRNPKWNDVVTFEYRCSSTMYGKRECKQRVMSGPKLHNAVISSIKHYLGSPAFKKMLKEETQKPLDTKGSQTNKLNIINKKLEAVERKIKKQMTAYENDWITDGDYANAMSRLKSEKNALSAVRDEGSQKEENPKRQKTKLEELWKAVDDFDSFWEVLGLSQKKQFLRDTLEEVKAGGGDVKIKFKE